jgi:hypothetical protein
MRCARRGRAGLRWWGEADSTAARYCCLMHRILDARWRHVCGLGECCVRAPEKGPRTASSRRGGVAISSTQQRIPVGLCARDVGMRAPGEGRPSHGARRPCGSGHRPAGRDSHPGIGYVAYSKANNLGSTVVTRWIPREQRAAASPSRQCPATKRVPARSRLATQGTDVRL